MKVENPYGSTARVQRIHRAANGRTGSGRAGKGTDSPVGRDMVSQARTAMAEFQRLQSFSSDWSWSECAVIARKWEDLVPVRSFCEIHNIPVQMGNEEIPSFWRLPGDPRVCRMAARAKTGIVSGADIDSWLDTQTPGYWNDLLRQAVDEYALETGSVETSVVRFIEWLAEWGRQIRRRSEGFCCLPRTAPRDLSLTT